MTAHAYTEDQLVEQSRKLSGLFAELGWQTVSVLEEIFGPAGTLLRETADLATSPQMCNWNLKS